MNPQDQVHALHVAMDLPAPARRLPLRKYCGDLRGSLLTEGVLQLRSAYAEGDVIRVIDALGDTLYVAYGAAVALGVDLECGHTTLVHRPSATSWRDGVQAQLDRIAYHADAFGRTWALWKASARVARWRPRRQAYLRDTLVLALRALVMECNTLASELNVDIEPFFDEIHRCYMAKAGGDGGDQRAGTTPRLAEVYADLYGDTAA